MMLRSLVDEVVRRRLWPIPLAALLIIIAGPLLFMKSAPSNAPAADEAPAAAKPGKLPSGAAKLVTTSDKAVTPRHKAAGSEDPFSPPASVVQTATAANSGAAKSASSSSSSSSSAGASKGKTASTLNVVVTDKTKNKVATKKSAKKKTKKQPTAPSVKTTNVAKPVSHVSVRFGEGSDGKLRRGVSRMQTFDVGDQVVAMFVKYSPARDKAVFAIAPSTQVTGDVVCRQKAGVCRYVDIPAGKSVRLTLRAADGSIVSRVLSVVGVGKVTRTVADVTAPTASSPAHTNAIAKATCLLKSLLALPAILPSISVDACD